MFHSFSSSALVYKTVLRILSPHDPDVLFTMPVSKPLLSALPYPEFAVTGYSLISWYIIHKKSCSGRSIYFIGTVKMGIFVYN